MKITSLFFTFMIVGCSPKLSPQIISLDELQGQWGMFKDKHPDGWGNWNPPYLYYEFGADSTYYHTLLQRRSETLIFGSYDVLGDSMIVLQESNGIVKNEIGQAMNDTLKIYYLDENYLELHRHWYTVFGKRTKPWKWKMKFRKLYPDEKELLEDKINELQIKYKKIEADSK